MENRTEDQVIYPKDLLFAALYRWRAMIVAAVVLGLLLGGFMAVKGFGSAAAPDEQAQLAYEQALEEHQDMLRILQKEAQALEQDVEHQEQYIKESLYLALDPHAHYRAVAVLYVEEEDLVRSEQSGERDSGTSSLVAAYEEMIDSAGFRDAIAQALGEDPQYVKELYSVSHAEDANILVLEALHTDEAKAGAMLEEALRQLRKLEASLQTNVAAHSLNILGQEVGLHADAEMLSNKRNNDAHLKNLKENLKEKELEIANLAEPAAPSVSGGFSAKKTVLLAVVGAVAGAAMVAVWAWLSHAVSTRVYSARVLRGRTGVKVLGCMAAKEVKNPVDRWLRSLEGRNLAPAQEHAAVLARDVAQRCGDAKTLLVTGDYDTQADKTLVEALRAAMPGVSVLDHGSILRSGKAVEALAQADAVVLAEQCGKSLCGHVSDELAMIGDYRAKLLGCVLLDG